MTIDLDVLEGLANDALALDCGNEGWFIPANFAKIMEPADAALCAAVSPTQVLALIAAARERDGLREAASVLLAACEEDFGVPDKNDGDDEAVGASLEGDCAVTFGMMRTLRQALQAGEKG